MFEPRKGLKADVNKNDSGMGKTAAEPSNDPLRKLYYPLSNGRNFPEIKRLLIALQTSDAHGCATPADWQPGDDVIVPPPDSRGTAKQRMENPDPDACALDGFMTFKKLPKERLNLPPAAHV